MLSFAEKALSGLQRELPQGVRPILAGSIAKGTFLAGNADVDLFAIFPHTYAKEDMFEETKKAAKKAFKGAKFEERFAEHPYLTIRLKGKKLDIVPSYEMKAGEKVKSAVDRSQLHTQFVLAHLPENKKGEVRLLKQFLKANLLYGAEIKVKGFSGYLCELMVIQFGTFENFLQEAQKWDFPHVLDPAELYDNPSEIPKFDSSLIVIDPVDRTRNVAAIITPENLHRLKNIAREFSRRPSEAFFFPPKKSAKELSTHAKDRNIFAFSFKKAPSIVDDVLWGQLWRFAGQLSTFLRRAEFEVIGVHAHSTDKECIILFEVAYPTLSKEQVFRGPPSSEEKHVRAFKKNHKGKMFIEGGRACVKEKRKLWNIQLALKEFMRKKDHPSHVQPFLSKSRLLDKKNLISRYEGAISEYFWIRCFTE